MIRTLFVIIFGGAFCLLVSPSVSAESNPSPPRSVFNLNTELLPLSPVTQQNAIGMAEDYIGMSAFSRQGLIEQLQYEGFSTADAVYAVDYITVDWNQQAARMAKEYLQMTSYSQSGLIEQLEYEGFTPSQAAYGVSVAYR